VENVVPDPSHRNPGGEALFANKLDMMLQDYLRQERMSITTTVTAEIKQAVPERQRAAQICACRFASGPSEFLHQVRVLAHE